VTDREILAKQRNPDEYLAITRQNIRTFGIIAHVDHGKSTLADRLLEITGAVPEGVKKQYLDRLPVERSRGITVKAQSVTLLHDCPVTNERYLLNLIDTPGHADFAFEVSRSLLACDGALLLVDATQGVQAQTIATFYLALERDLTILPVANKVDMENADVSSVATQMAAAFGMDVQVVDGAEGVFENPHALLLTSAKTGLGVNRVLNALVKHVPSPKGVEDSETNATTPLRARLLDCHYDPYRGAVSTIQVVDGAVKVGDKITSHFTNQTTEVLELGFMTPEPLKTNLLTAGHVGYLITGNRDVKSAKIGDTLYSTGSGKASSHATIPDPLPGFKPAKPMVFQGVFPSSADQFENLRVAIEKLTLNDSSVTFSTETSVALGPGFRCGFLGLLHADVFHQRLAEELGIDVVATAPTVPYRVKYGDRKKDEKSLVSNDANIDSDDASEEQEGWTVISSPSLFDQERLRKGGGGSVEEPVVDATIVCSSDVVGRVVELCIERRGEQMEHLHLGQTRVMLRYRVPLAEMASDFSDALKSRTSGYATFDYEEAGYRQADVVRLDVLVNGVPVDALSTICHRSGSTRKGKDIVAKLKNTLPRQLFEVAVQASVNGAIVARETVSAMRKNVLAKCYGGDVSRKKKLLSKQKEGKKRMRRVGNVDVPVEAFKGLLGTGR
tara:strand:+ start:8296 stop:10311 length:2016 start_codon:yes stop_codon:yes gene_type:complete